MTEHLRIQCFIDTIKLKHVDHMAHLEFIFGSYLAIYVKIIMNYAMRNNIHWYNIHIWIVIVQFDKKDGIKDNEVLTKTLGRSLGEKLKYKKHNSLIFM